MNEQQIKEAVCPNCEGKGYTFRNDGGKDYAVNCRECEGTGKQPDVAKGDEAVCPQCGNKLHKVTRSEWSPLNEHQFEASKAGDYYCDKCPNNNRGNAPFCYWWDSEIEIEATNKQPDIVKGDEAKLREQIQSLTAQVESLNRTLKNPEMPGAWTCMKCGFTLQKNTLHSGDGQLSADTSPLNEICPNDGNLMKPLTWREANEGFSSANSELNQKVRELTTQVEKLRETLGSIKSYCEADFFYYDQTVHYINSLAKEALSTT